MQTKRMAGMKLAVNIRTKPKVDFGGIGRKTHYKMQVYSPLGILKWQDEFDNLVVDAGLNDSLDKHLKGSGYTAAWYVGLTDGTPTIDSGDTMSSHAGWVEVTTYDEADRQTLTLGTVSGGSVDNSASPAVFTISGSVTVGGAFIASTNNKGGTTGVLYGGGALNGGDRLLGDGDTVEITATLTTIAV